VEPIYTLPGLQGLMASLLALLSSLHVLAGLLACLAGLRGRMSTGGPVSWRPSRTSITGGQERPGTETECRR